MVKVDAVERLRAELAHPLAGEPIAMGTNTDPYQPAEGAYLLDPGAWSANCRLPANPFSILTKSSMILRDLDLLVEAAAGRVVRLALDRHRRRRDPAARPSRRGAAQKRLEAVARLAEAGPRRGAVAPVLPGISDAEGSCGRWPVPVPRPARSAPRR